MSFSLPKAAGVVALACAASALALPLAAPAAAAAPADELFVAADTDNSLDDPGYTLSGLYTMPVGTSTRVVPESPSVHVHDVSGSADGSRLIYVQDNFSAATGDPVSTQVVVRDVSTRVVRVLETRAWDDLHYLGAPALSPSGTAAVWELYYVDPVGAADSVTMRKAAVASGGATTLKPGLSPYAFLNDTTVLAQDIAGHASTVTLSGTTGAVQGVPAEALNVTVSPDGSRVAWGLFDPAVPENQPVQADLQVAALASGVSGWTAGTPVTLTTTAYNTQPSFSRDGKKVFWVRNSGSFEANSDVWSASVDGVTNPAAAVAATAADENDVAVLTPDDGTAPGALGVLKPAVLKGTQATLSWTLPADTDLSGTVITRSGSTRAIYVPFPLTSFTDSGLRLGTTYAYKVQAVDRSNHYGQSSSLTLRAVRAAPSVADPTTRTSAKASFPVTFGPVAATGTTYTVQYLATGGSWTTWLTDYAGRAATFNGAPGKSYSFRVTVRDGNGNSSPTVTSGRTVVPFDQTRARFSGGGNVYTKSAFLGSYRKLWRTNHVARVTLVGNRLQIIGATCGTCGVFDLFDNGRWVAGVNTRSSVTLLRRVLFTKTYATSGSHAYTLKPRATKRHPDVKLDGFAMRT